MLEVALLLQAVLWLSVVLILFVLRRRFTSAFDPAFFYLVFHGIVFVVRPLLARALGWHQVQDHMQFYPSDGQVVRALLVSSVALLVFCLSTTLAGRTRAVFHTNAPFGTGIQKKALIATWALLGPFAIYSAVLGIAGVSFAGNGSLQMESINGIAVYTNTTGYLVDAQQMLLPLVVLTLLVWRYTLMAWLPMLAFVGYRAYMGWSRWTIVTVFIMLFLASLYQMRHRWPRPTAVARGLVLAPFIFTLFFLLGENRDVVRDLASNQSSTRNDLPLGQKLDNLDFANFDYLTFVVAIVPTSTGTYTYGTQYLQLFTEPIPRILWPQKPVGAPIKFFELNDYGYFSNLTLSLPGDGWLSGGWLGVVLTMALAGVALGRLHRWFWRSQQDVGKSMIYLMVLAVSFLWFRDGGIYIVKFLLFTLPPIAVWRALTHFVHRRSQRGLTAHLQARRTSILGDMQDYPCRQAR